MVRRRIWIFVGKIHVIPPPQIIGIGVGVIVWPSIKVVEGISLFNGECREVNDQDDTHYALQYYRLHKHLLDQATH